MKAEEMIKNAVVEEFPRSSGVVPESVAMKAVEAARREERKRAVEVHRMCCPSWNSCPYRVGKKICERQCYYVMKFEGSLVEG